MSLLQHPAEEQAACLCWVFPRAVHLRSTMPLCQAGEGGGWLVGRGTVLATGKGHACMPWGRLCAAVRIPDPHPANPHLASATSRLTEGNNPGQWRDSGLEEYHHPVATSGRERERERLAGSLFIETFSLHLTCQAKLGTACYWPRLLECGEGIYNSSSLLVVQNLNKYEMWELYPPEDMFN